MRVCLIAPAPNAAGATAHSPRGLAYLEVPDFRAHGIVPLQARRGGDPLLAGTTIATRVSPSTELVNLQDGKLHLPGNQRLAELEREQLRLSDRLVWSGGDGLGLYRRYYGEEDLPPGVRIRPAVEPPVAAPPPAASLPEG